MITSNERTRKFLRSWLADFVEMPTYRQDGETDDEQFKQAIADGFSWLENWAEQRDIRRYNWKNRVLELEIGSGPEVGLATHFDVVPYSAEEWDKGHPGQLNITEEDGETVFYGRGVIDDKGLLVSHLLLFDYLNRLSSLPLTLRLIVDSAEEVGFDNIRAYFENSERSQPARSLVADGFYPMVAGEKGLLQARVTIDGGDVFSSSPITLESLSGGEAFNQVPGRAVGSLHVNGDVDPDPSEAISDLKEEYPGEIDLKYENANIDVSVYGQKAHGSAPDEGINAITGFLACAEQLIKPYGTPEPVVNLLEMFLDESGQFLTDASGFDLDRDDSRFESGTTVNLGKVHYDDESGFLKFDFDFRLVPDQSPDDVLEYLNQAFKSALSGVDFDVEAHSSEDSLLVDTESDLPEAALRGYRSVRKKKTEPIYMGGRTHATPLNEAFAFGGMEPERFESYGFHGPDERVKEEELIDTAEIYRRTLEEYSGEPLG